ncbi:MAG TPA: nitroreductase family protein [Smithellaceae bacterium]|jgi:nitroreductase|nr:nitroreductase family protein [Syntrophaceae bacterium]HPV50193.1 nitroreductase family protein [Smithellaceae bacterium]
MNVYDFRKRENAVDEIFIRRWSPRAMSGEGLDEETLRTLLEAARWAPSSNNNQPWRFIYARRQTPHWERFFNLLDEGNQNWAKDAAVLMVVVSKTTFDSGKPSRTHSFDTGAAWLSLALQGSMKGLVVHGMQGFNYERAQKELQVPEGYAVEAMIAIGRPGRKEDLPEYQQKREFPSSRKTIPEIAMEGFFQQNSP